MLENFFTFSLIFGAFSWAHHKSKFFILIPTFFTIHWHPRAWKEVGKTPISVPYSGCLVYDYETACQTLLEEDKSI